MTLQNKRSRSSNRISGTRQRVPQPPCPQFLPSSLRKENKPKKAACCDAFEAANAFPTESFPAAALSEMSNANKDEELFILFTPLPLADSHFWQRYQVNFGKRNLKVVFFKIISVYFTSEQEF